MSTITKPTSPTSSSTINTAKRLSLSLPDLLTFILVLLCHAPLLLLLYQRMWGTDHYQFFPLIFVGAGFLLYLRRDEWDGLTRGNIYLRLVLWTATGCLAGAAIFVRSPWLASISLMSVFWAIAYSSGGGSLLRSVFPIWCFLWLTVPFPLGLDLQLIQSLQLTATQWASSVLDLIGVYHLVAGVTLELPGHSFLVEEACSGIHSLFAALSCTAFYLIFAQRGLIRSLTLLVSVPFWVLVANATRVTAVTLLGSRWKIPVTEGWTHELFGLLVFLLSLALIVSADRLLLFLAPIRPKFAASDEKVGLGQALGRKLSVFSGKRRRTASGKPPESPSPPARRTLEWTFVCVLFGGLLFAQFAFGLWKPRLDNSVLTHTLKPVPNEALPKTWNDWQLTRHQTLEREKDDPNGAFTQQWTYQQSERSLIVSLDGPFIGWHNLSGCLVGQGWDVEQSENHSYNCQEMPSNCSGGFTEMIVKRGEDRHAFVIFGVFDKDHQGLSPADTYVGFRTVRRFPQLSELLARTSGEKEPGDEGGIGHPSYQVQVFYERPIELTEEEKNLARELFFESRRRILDAKPVVEPAAAQQN